MTHATRGFYTYGFLDPANGRGKLAGYIVGILVGTVVIFGVVWVMIWLSWRLTEGKRRGKMAEEEVGREGVMSEPRDGDVEMRRVGVQSDT